jgi:hypothetical protein
MAPCRSSRIPRRTILMPASGVSRQPTDGPDDTHRGLATRVVYSPYRADWFPH